MSALKCGDSVYLVEPGHVMPPSGHTLLFLAGGKKKVKSCVPCHLPPPFPFSQLVTCKSPQTTAGGPDFKLHRGWKRDVVERQEGWRSGRLSSSPSGLISNRGNSEMARRLEARALRRSGGGRGDDAARSSAVPPRCCAKGVEAPL